MIDELERLLAQATPGTWEADEFIVDAPAAKPTLNVDRRVVASGFGGTERAIIHAALIAAAVNALPALIRVARAARLMHESQMCGMDIVASAHYDDMIDALAALREVQP